MESIEITPIKIEEEIPEQRCIEPENPVLGSIFDKIDATNETYQSYRVYIVRDGDSVQTIMDKYSIAKEELEKYNDLSEIKINDKIIIPTIYVSD